MKGIIHYMVVSTFLLAGCSLFGEEKEDSRCSGWRSQYEAKERDIYTNIRLTARQKQFIQSQMNDIALKMRNAECDNAPIPIRL